MITSVATSQNGKEITRKTPDSVAHEIQNRHVYIDAITLFVIS
jgi:hypothetical protein